MSRVAFAATRYCQTVFSLVIISCAMLMISGCSNDKGFDPKALSGGDSPEMQQANKSMEDFMKTQGKAKSK